MVRFPMKFMKDMKGQRNRRLRELARNFTQKGKTRGAREHASFIPLHDLQVLHGNSSCGLSGDASGRLGGLEHGLLRMSKE